MELKCRIEKINKNQEGLPEGNFLIVNFNKGEDVFIFFEEFNKQYEAASRERGANDSLIEINNDDNIQPAINERPNYKNLLQYLSNKLGISETTFKDDNILIIESSFGNFLELPWEEIVDTRIIVLRKVISNKKTNPEHTHNSLLFILASSNINHNGRLPDLKDKIADEINSITKKIILAAPKDYNIKDVRILKSITRELFSSLPWEEYNFIHFLMHGDENGGICLESKDDNNYKNQDIICIADVISCLREENFLLMFFSFCFSGGGVNGANSLSCQLTNEGITKYAIGYRNEVGEKSARNFSNIFYNILLDGYAKGTGQHIEETYKKAMTDYSKILPDMKYLPLLFINC